MMTVSRLFSPRWTRRSFAGTLAAASAATALSPVAGVATPAAAAATQLSVAATVGGLRLLPPYEAPYDVAGRRELAMDALTFYVRQKGNVPGRSVYQLPAAPWLGGNLDPVPRYAWDMA